jgi:nitroreductase
LDNQILKSIINRRSVREFIDLDVSAQDLESILEAGRWAPSGLNNQPWRFVIIQSPEKKAELAELTHYGRIVTSAPVLIAVFMDAEASYDRTKDCQAVGACLQNMLLAAHSLGLGAVWLGEILKNGDKVAQRLEQESTLELMAVLAVGHPQEKDRKSARRPLEELIAGRF